MDIMIRTENLCKRFTSCGGIVEAITDLSLKLPRGHCLLLRGPSGSGKSTLLNIIGCLTHPTSGKVYLDGREVSHLPDHFLTEIRRKTIGFVFQAFNLLEGYTVLDNIGMPLVPLGLDTEQREHKALSLLRRVDLEHRARFLVNELSGGERQRVAVARALVNDPAVIVADEPNSNVDQHDSRLIMAIFHQLKKEGRTLVVSSHDPAFGSDGLVDQELTMRAAR
jgi:putative ABC transport system ATP-binding protein